jgi:hypothetical protein
VAVSGAVTVDPNVTLTVAAGTTVNMASAASISVGGTMAVQGAYGNKVILQGDPAGTSPFWAGVQVPMGGTLTMSYGSQVGGGIELSGGTATITYSHMANSEGDYLVMNGGTLTVKGSSLGIEPGSGTNATHCDMHMGGALGNVITFVHSSISTSAYGIMFYNGQNAKFMYNNWLANTYQVDIQQGSPVSGDFGGSYFDASPITVGSGLTTSVPLSATRLPACLPDGSNMQTCAGDPL